MFTRRTYSYAFEGILLGTGVLIGDLVGWLLILTAVAAIIVTIILTGDYKLIRLPDVRTGNDRMPLNEVTALMYANARPDLQEMAVSVSDSAREGATPAIYFQYMLRSAAEEGRLDIFGRRAPDLHHEPVTAEALRKGGIIEGNNLTHWFEDRPVWYDLEVSKRAALIELRSYDPAKEYGGR